MNLDDLLKSENAAFSFRPDDGAFRSRLVELLLAGESEAFVELFSENNCDMLVRISGSSLEDALIHCQVGGDFGERGLECRLSGLKQPELGDLVEQMSHLDASQPVAPALSGGKNVLRRKGEINLLNMLNIEEAAQQLSLSTQLLKSRIPCTDYSYNEVNDKIVIKDYYWSKSLVERLAAIKASGATAEDSKYIADECCHGDLEWAKEIIGLFSRQQSSGQRDNAPQKNSPKALPGNNPPRSAHHRHHRKKPA